MEETGRFAVETDLAIARDRRNLCVRAFDTLLPAAAVHLPHPLRRAALRRAGHERRGDRRRARWPPTRSRGRRRRPARAAGGTAPRGPPRQRRRRPAGRLRAVRGRRAPSASAVPPGLEAVLVVPRRAVRTREARAALPAAVPMADAVFNVGHAGAARCSASRAATSTSSRAACRPAAPAPPGAPLSRARPRCWAARRSSARSARRSRAPGRRCWCGARPTRRAGVVARARGRGGGVGRRPARSRFEPRGAAVVASAP